MGVTSLNSSPCATRPCYATGFKQGSFLLAILNGRSGIAIRFQFWGRRAPDSKPVSPEDPPCMAPIARHAVAKCPPAGVVRKLGEGTSLGAVLVI
ncbi:hypothetical protein AVEN_128056-1 [Araneus ventricosus]|uniref:Uncharacterized protein n=1 Tax=Araneus ventricosus TaxID=182803 RepID=A0A4Y2A0F8_ARAVE|nr:hypothetical protein AVEN_128056-1 [Araneus ventricosus]